MLKLKSGVVSTLSTRFSKNFSKFSTAPDISQHSHILVFALGGPGSGKTTQCSRIAKHFGFTHLCAGDLLRAEIKSASSDGTIIHKLEKEGKIVPSEITVKLLQKAMQRSENNKFIIDGFPRNEENRRRFEKIMNMEPDSVLFFDCPEEELMKRLISRNQGRADDNVDIIPKRLQVYFESTLPVINYYSSQRKIQKINAGRSIDVVFEDVKGIFSNLKPQAELNSTNESS